MKLAHSLALTASIVTALAITSCDKEQDAQAISSNNPTYSTQGAARTSATYSTAPDRIDEIVKDLSLSSYSLSLSQSYPESGVTKTAYGTDNYLAFADPQDLICPEPIRLKFKKIPIWRRPNIIWPTCPDMIIDITRLQKVKDVLVNADYKTFGSLQEVKLITGGGFLAGEQFRSSFKTMQLDKIDELTKDLKPESFLMLNDPRNLGPGATRTFYGTADLNSIVLKPYRKNLKDILKPTLKGCFDPQVLSALRDRLQKIDQSYYKSLSVTPLAENKSIAVLSMY